MKTKKRFNISSFYTPNSTYITLILFHDSKHYVFMRKIGEIFIKFIYLVLSMYIMLLYVHVFFISRSTVFSCQILQILLSQILCFCILDTSVETKGEYIFGLDILSDSNITIPSVSLDETWKYSPFLSIDIGSIHSIPFLLFFWRARCLFILILLNISNLITFFLLRIQFRFLKVSFFVYAFILAAKIKYSFLLWPLRVSLVRIYKTVSKQKQLNQFLVFPIRIIPKGFLLTNNLCKFLMYF